MIYIYALDDPFTGETRYIGKSIRPKERLANECNEHAKTYRCHWIQSVLALGKRPIQRILEVLPDDADWQESERQWIAKGRELGWPLVNSTSGGDGVPDLPEETRRKMAAVWRGRKHKPESLVKIGKASRGRKHDQSWREHMRSVMKDREFTDAHRVRLSLGVRKLADCDVQDIKRRLAIGEMVKDIAAAYGVHRTTISKIKMGQYCAYLSVADEESACTR